MPGALGPEPADGVQAIGRLKVDGSGGRAIPQHLPFKTAFLPGKENREAEVGGDGRAIILGHRPVHKCAVGTVNPMMPKFQTFSAYAQFQQVKQARHGVFAAREGNKNVIVAVEIRRVRSGEAFAII